MVLEARRDVAATLVVGDWGTESGCVGCAVGDAGGCGSTGEEPSPDGSVIPLHGVDTATLAVETGSVRGGAGVIGLASCSACKLLRAFIADLLAALAETVNLASGIGVEVDLVDGL